MARSLETAGIEVERPDAERLSADDLATHREQQFLDAALSAHRNRVERAPVRHVAGICSNCDARLVPIPPAQSVPPDQHYCDGDCRDDHDRRLRAAARR